VLVLPLAADGAVLSPERIAQALERVDLSGRVVLDQEQWGRLERAVVISWLPHP
jgi:hypothetical protein